MMKYADIINLLKTNPRYKAKRSSWTNTYITMDNDKIIMVYQYTIEEDNSVGFTSTPFVPAFADLAIPDWEIIEG